MERRDTVIIGAGPAGLTAAYELYKRNHTAIVLEQEKLVGGLARTECRNGFLFDIGGHRFFTKLDTIEALWREWLPADFLRRPRLSRIYYNRKFFYYPLKPLNSIAGLGCRRAVIIVLSYLRWQIFPCRREETFEQWVTNRFGRKLFQVFFKPYTEKVWGISCSELRAEWAAQRIRGLSLKTAVFSMFAKPKRTIKTLIEDFYYPRRGPGMMWQAVKEKIEQNGSAVRLNCNVIGVLRNASRIESVVVSTNGQCETIAASSFVSTIPLNELVLKLEPPAPGHVLHAAQRLRYRALIVICLIIDREHLFPDNWIYVHDPEVRVGRIQNYKNWSPEMVPDTTKTSLGMEYFCSVGDSLWNRRDAELVELAKLEIARIGLASSANIQNAYVIRAPHAYPIYDADYSENLGVVREFLSGLSNLQTIGRNGLHRYNNQDHAMMTGILAARNVALEENNDVWSVNTEPDYHEETWAAEAIIDEALSRIFTKLDRVAFGTAIGTVAGALLLIATLLMLVVDTDGLAHTLQLLNQYFPGYRVSVRGSLVGFFYAFAAGFAAGWLFACLRNAMMFLSLVWLERKAQRGLMRRVLDYI
jgi:protoporphyrinogen oxidase